MPPQPGRLMDVAQTAGDPACTVAAAGSSGSAPSSAGDTSSVHATLLSVDSSRSDPVDAQLLSA